MSQLKDAYQIITDTIIKSLEQGVIPWKKTWQYSGAGAVPKNLITKKNYRGINRLLLMSRTFSENFSSPFWLTFNQCKKMGGYIKRGSVSTPIAFWKWIDIELKIEDADNLDNWNASEIGRGYKVLKRKPFLTYYRVFNLDQTEGIAKEKIPVSVLSENDPIEGAEKIIAGYRTMPAIEKGDPAYSSVEDKIFMPDITHFESSEGYYSTLFHECVHSTGHESRLNRPGITCPTRKGSDEYSFEELVAEIGACFLNLEAGIKNVTFVNSTAYIQSWLQVLKNDRKFVILAASQAQTAADYISGVEHVGDE